MNRHREIIIFILLSVLVTSGMAAASWSQNITAIKNVATNSGTVSVRGSGVLTSAGAEELGKRALESGATKMFWRIPLRLLGVVGTVFLVYDIYNMLSDLDSIPGVKNHTPLPEGQSNVVAQYPGGSLYCETAGLQYWNGTASIYAGVKITVSLNNGFPTITNVEGLGTGLPDSQNRIASVSTYVHAGNENFQIQTFNFCSRGFYCEVVTTNPGGATINYYYNTTTINEQALQDYINAHPELFQNPNKGTATIEDTEPADAIDAGEGTSSVTQSDTQTGQNPDTYVDPATGQSSETVTNPSDSTDTLTIPDRPGELGFDTLVETPDTKSIPDLVTSFLGNAPFMNIINNFQVTASSGSSSLQFSVFGRTIDWDFNQYHSIYASMAAIIIALAYIWAVQIVFGGRA